MITEKYLETSSIFLSVKQVVLRCGSVLAEAIRLQDQLDG